MDEVLVHVACAVLVHVACAVLVHVACVVLGHVVCAVLTPQPVSASCLPALQPWHRSVGSTALLQGLILGMHLL